MKIGFASLVGVEPRPLPELVREAAALGLEAIEINAGPTFGQIGDQPFGGHLDPAAVVAEGPGRITEQMAEHGMSIAALAPMLNLLAPDPKVRDERIAYLRSTIAAAAALGVSTVVTYGGSDQGMQFWGLPAVGEGHPSNRLDDNLRLFQEIYTPLAAYAEERGVRIAFETAPRGGGQGNIAHAPALWDRLFDAVPSPALGLSLDPSHLVWLQIPDPAAVIRAYGSRVYHLDGKDAEILPERLAHQGIYGPSWWRYRLPGLGALDWRAILSAAKDIGYDGPLSIENEDPHFLGLAGVAWSATYLRGLEPGSDDGATGAAR